MGATPTENTRRMREYIGAWNDHDIEAIIAFFADEYLQEIGYEEAVAICETWFKAFPDLTHEINQLAADGDWVLGRLVLRGTHEGSYKGVPATGTEIEVPDHFSTRFVDGKIVAHHALADEYTLFRQLGVSLPPERTRDAENKALVRRYFEALNDRNKAAFRETMANDFTYGEIQSREEHIETDWKWLDALDLTWDIQAMHAGDGFVTTRLKATGTHCGELLGIEPTGESVDVTAMTLSRIEDGKISEWWSEWDFAGFLHQIGAIDAPVYGG